MKVAIVIAAFFACICAHAQAGPGSSVCADAAKATFKEKPHGTYHALIENDAFTGYLGARNTDRWYTNGVKFMRELDVNEPPLWVLCGPPGLANLLQFGRGEEMEVQYGYALGQLMFTPQKITDPAPQPLDRYWGGWLYLGTIVQRRPKGSDDQLETLELDYGVVGPASLAEQAQKVVHGLMDIKKPQGWSNQLKTEPGIQMNYLRSDRLRHSTSGPDDLGYDITSHAGGMLGTMFTSVNGGIGLRVGKRLAGSPVGTIELPALGGMASPADRWYTLFRMDVRRVLHNTFIDGSLFRSDPYASQIGAKDWVVQSTMGFVMEWQRGSKLMLLLNRRSPEFNNIVGATPIQMFMTIGVSWQYD